MKNIYEECPVLESETFQFHLIQPEDARELLKVYSDEKAVPFFNGDNCNGDDFHYTTLEKMKEVVKYWRWEYDVRKGFVRLTIVDKIQKQAVGTIEIFKRESDDFYNQCGLLRIDLRSDYETEALIFEILSVMTKAAYQNFECEMVATKAIPEAVQRIDALKKARYQLSTEKLYGHDGTAYENYWIIRKEWERK